MDGDGIGGTENKGKGREQVDACDGQESQSAEKRSEVNQNQGQTQNQRTGALLGCQEGWVEGTGNERRKRRVRQPHSGSNGNPA